MPIDPNASCTVCIPTYNQAEYLRAAVESVAAQTAPVRLLVSDDASPDNTAAVLAALQRQYTFHAEHHATNLGISANLEWLLTHAETLLIVRLDSDDLLHPGFVAELSALLVRNPQAGYAHCAIREIGAAGEVLGERRLGRSAEYQDGDAALRRAVNGYQVAANILMFRRDALASVEFGAGSAHLNFVEDYDLSVRLAGAGWGNVYSPQVLASYRMWTAASRPPVARKQREIEGVRHIFTGSLEEAFLQRGWSMAPLRSRRQQLALANAEILDRAILSPAERTAMIDALTALAGNSAVRYAFGPGLLATMFRRAHAYSLTLRQSLKRAMKTVLFRG